MGNSLKVEQKFIAFLDILGFKEMIHREDDLETFGIRYKRVFQGREVRELARNRGIEFAVASDSILVTVKKPASPCIELTNLVSYCGHLLSLSILNRFPLCGSISYGKICWSEKVKVGQAIVDAVYHESLQDWIGIMIAPSASRFLNEHLPCRKELERSLVVEIDVPVKEIDGETKIRACIVPPQGPEPDLDRELRSELKNLLLETSNPMKQRKYRRTLEMLEQIEQVRGGKLDGHQI